MNQTPARQPVALTIALVAASTLVYEILLTRVSALRLAFHFSYLVVANALLAVGAAGALLYLARERIRGREERVLRGLLWTYALALPLTYTFLLGYPAPYDVRVTTGEHLASFLAYNLGAALPLFCAGGAIGLMLLQNARDVHRVYAADLVGAALGCVLCPYLLWFSGAGGALAGALALALGSTWTAERGRARLVAGALGALTLVALPFVDARFPVPSKTELQLTSETKFIAGDRIIESRWSAISRVDLASVPPAEQNLFMRGPAVELPRPERQAFLMQDGSAGTYVHDYTGTPEGLVGLSRSLYSLAARALQPESVFIIGVGGGDDLWAHHHAGTARIKGIELNRQILDVHRTTLEPYSRALLADPAVELVHGEGRTALLREASRFDLVQMSAIDTWTALQSGAYMLAENFLYTQDSIDDMFRILAEDGAVQITRFSGDVEAIRLVATLRAAHARYGAGPFVDCVVCVPGNAYMSVLVKRRPFDEGELARLDAFLREGQFPIAYHPRAETGSAVEAYIRSSDPAQLIANAAVDLRPVSDDRPYFFNFLRWSDLGHARETLDAAITVTQGNPLFLFGQLALSILAGIIVLGAPLLFARRGAAGTVALAAPRARAGAAALYFGAVGAGFISAEVALMQKLVLMLGHPLYSVTVTLAAMLLATGLGAYLSRRAFAAPTRAIWCVPLVLSAAFGLLAAFDADLIRAVAPLPTAARFAVAALVVAPIGLAVGVPFSHGLALLERAAPRLVPWAWATNAIATVVGSIATVIVSMNFGFRAVFVVAVALYALAAAAAPRLHGAAPRP
ncbi:MAG: hypothetical protein R3F49_15035 [Planctomycetota bacterium]